MSHDEISILVVDDEERIREFLLTEMTRMGYRMDEATNGEEAVEKAKTSDYHVILMDMRMPRMTGLEALAKLREIHPTPEVIIITGHGTIDTAIEAMRLGAYHYVTKPFKLRELELHVQKAYERVALKRKSQRLERLIRDGTAIPGIVGRSKAMRRVLSLIGKVAPTNSSVLITGESGTGKELVAHSIHNASTRADHPFVDVNCGTLQEALLETELFGHEKGAFTDAHQTREGLMEVADHGTLFLDEIGEMSRAVQVKLLRAVEEREVRRLGSDRTIRVDVRVIAATNVDLANAVRNGRFREDLFYRLNVFPIEVPTLRARSEDIPDLIEHFLSTIPVPGKGPFTITNDALAALARYPWPGNVRELMNTVERMKILSDGTTLDLGAVPAEVLRDADSAPPAPGNPALTLAELERRHILRILDRTGGNKTRAASILGITTRTIYNKLSGYQGP